MGGISHDSGLADLRWEEIIEKPPEFCYQRRGTNMQLLSVKRIYPRALEDGNPDVIEGCIAACPDEEGSWTDVRPTAAFVSKADRGA